MRRGPIDAVLDPDAVLVIPTRPRESGCHERPSAGAPIVYSPSPPRVLQEKRPLQKTQSNACVRARTLHGSIGRFGVFGELLLHGVAADEVAVEVELARDLVLADLHG